MSTDVNTWSDDELKVHKTHFSVFTFVYGVDRWNPKLSPDENVCKLAFF